MNADIYEFRDIIAHGCYDIIQPDVTFSGGLSVGKKIAAMAEAANVVYNPHTWTNGIGLAANLQLMGAIPNCTYCEYPFDPPGWVPEGRDAMLKEPIRVDADGYITIPSRPGLGVEIDMERVLAHGTKL